MRSFNYNLAAVLVALVLLVALAVQAQEPAAPVLPTDPGQSARARGGDEGAVAPAMPVPGQDKPSVTPLGESRADTEEAARLVLAGKAHVSDSGKLVPVAASPAHSSGLSAVAARKIAERVNQENPIGGTPKSQAKVRNWLHGEGFQTKGDAEGIVSAGISNYDASVQARFSWVWLALVLVLAVAIGGYFFPRLRGCVPPGPTY